MAYKQESTVFWVEDDPDHTCLIEKNLDSNITNDIITINDGHQVVDYPFSEGDYSRSRPYKPIIVATIPAGERPSCQS
jgi:hypothetical protein